MHVVLVPNQKKAVRNVPSVTLVKQESTKTKQEKPCANHAFPASGAKRFKQRMILTAKTAKWASTRLQKALILIVSFVQLGHVEGTESLVVQT